jgi:large repetitive protein
MQILVSMFLLVFAVGVSSTPCQAADVQISQFDDAPDPAVRGGDIIYTLNVENNAADTAGSVVLTIPLPVTTTFISATGTGCVHDGGSPGIVTCTLGDLLGTLVGGPVASVTVTIRTSAATGAVLDAASSVVTASSDTNLANNTAAQTTTINDGADLGVGKSGSPGSVVAGGLVDWTLISRNLGPNDATFITVTDTLPGTLTYVSTVSAPGWSCGASGQVVTCTRSSAAAGAALPDIVLRARVTGAVTGTVVNVAAIDSSTILDPFPINDTTTGQVTVTTGTDLSVGKSVAPNPVIGGQNAAFTVQPRNNGPFPADNVTVTDTLPDGFTFVSAAGTGWSCSAAGQVVTCTRSTYAVGAANDIAVVALAPSVAALTGYTNLASISSTTADPNSANNSTSLAFNVAADGRDLSLTKSKSPNPVAQNAEITSRLVVRNNGPRDAPAGSVRVTDTLDPASEAYGSPQPTPTVFFSGTGWTCTLTGNVVSCDYANALTVGSTATVDVFTTAWPRER